MISLKFAIKYYLWKLILNTKYNGFPNFERKDLHSNCTYRDRMIIIMISFNLNVNLNAIIQIIISNIQLFLVFNDIKHIEFFN